MSTRGIIVFVGKSNHGVDKGLRLYQHCDSYPTYTLPLIRNSIRKAEKLIQKAREKWSSSQESVIPELLAGLYLGESTSLFGMGASIEKTKILDSNIPAEILGLLGDQRDLEWVYVVDTDAKTVNVYGGGYTGKGPGDFYLAGTVEPLSYIENLSEEYQESEAKVIKSAKRSLARLGWPVNR